MESNTYPALESVAGPNSDQISASFNPFSSPHVCGADTCEGWFNATVSVESRYRFVHVYVDWSRYSFDRVMESALSQIEKIEPSRAADRMIIPVIHRTGGDTTPSGMAPVIAAIREHCLGGKYGHLYEFITCNANSSETWGSNMRWFNCVNPIDSAYYHVQRLFTGADPKYAKSHIDDYIKVLAEIHPELHAQDCERSAYGTSIKVWNLERAAISYGLLPPREGYHVNPFGIIANARNRKSCGAPLQHRRRWIFTRRAIIHCG